MWVQEPRIFGHTSPSMQCVPISKVFYRCVPNLNVLPKRMYTHFSCLVSLLSCFVGRPHLSRNMLFLFGGYMDGMSNSLLLIVSYLIWPNYVGIDSGTRRNTPSLHLLQFCSLMSRSQRKLGSQKYVLTFFPLGTHMNTFNLHHLVLFLLHLIGLSS